MLVEVNQASFGYSGRPVVQVNQLHLHAGRCLGIFGPNGAGKSTLVRGLAGLLLPIQGEVQRKPELRCGYVPQHRNMELHWPMTGFDAATLAISATRRFGWLGSAKERVRASMRHLEVDHLRSSSFAQLSGGQQQRLLLAGALAADPEVLLLDEPTEGLDVQSRTTVTNLIRQQQRDGKSIVLISHDVEDLLDTATDVAWLHPGEQEGQPSSVECISPAAFAEWMARAGRRIG